MILLFLHLNISLTSENAEVIFRTYNISSTFNENSYIESIETQKMAGYTQIFIAVHMHAS